MKHAIISVLFLCLVESLGDQYKGYRIYEVVPRTNVEVKVLNDLSNKEPQFDFLSQPGIVNATARVIVSPNELRNFESTLKKHYINYKTVNFDLSETIKEQQSLEPRGLFSRSISFKKYYRHKDIYKYLQKLAKEYPNRVKVETVGKSHEDRAIEAITITNGLLNSDKRVILIDAGIHAREWLAPATALYIIHQLVENYENNKNLLRNTEWVIIPLVNPDGYEYSHKKERLWRKTRKPNSNPKCPGTDGNRNFDYKWGLLEDGNSECSPIYHGPHNFSEPETRAVRDMMSRLAKNCKLYLSLHSFGRYILLPWSWDRKAPAGYKTMYEVAKAGFEAIKSKKGERYMIGRPMEVLKRVSGNSMDYAHGVVGIPVTITVELAPGGEGFDPPKSDIEGLAEEGWIGVKAMAEMI